LLPYPLGKCSAFILNCLSWHFSCYSDHADACESANVELLNQQVQFRVCDIYLPHPQTVMGELYGANVLQGRVLDITENDGGAKFAVVRVAELKNPVVIALEHVTGVERNGQRGRRL
jgi:hypothetical protein